MPPLRAVLFDFDGTLTDSLPLWVRAYHIALDAFGLKLSDAEVLRRCFFRDWRDVADDLGVCTESELKRAVDRGLEQAFLSAVLFPQARRIIEQCRERNLQTALVTSSPRSLIGTVAQRLDVHHLFDFTICGDEVTNYKPHPEPVLRTLEVLACAPREAIMIGDSTADVLAGKAAGTRTALFMPHDHHRFHDTTRLRASEPDVIFDDLDQLPSLLGFTTEKI